MPSSGVNCFSHHERDDLDKKFKAHIAAGVPEKEAARKVILEEHEKLHNELNDLRKKVNPKSKSEPYTPQDNSSQIQKINDEYDKKIASLPVQAEKKIGQLETTNETGEGSKPPDGGGEKLVGDEGEKKGGITHAAMAEAKTKAGLPDYEGKPTETHESLIAEAKARVSDNPNLANEVMEMAEKGGKVTNRDNAVLAVYKGALDAELETNPSKEIFDRISRLSKVLDPSGTELGKALESRKLIDFDSESLSNFLISKEAAQGAPLSDSQIKTESAKYNELKKAKDALSDLEKADKEEYAKLVAEIGVNKARAQRNKASKKTHEEYQADRKSQIEKARESLKKIRESGLQSTIPGLRELKALAPHVKELMKSYVDEGIDKLDVIVNNIYADIKDLSDGIRKSDIIEMIGGVHDERKQTRNEKASELRLIKREAELVQKLAKERKGEAEAKNEQYRVEKSRRVQELEEKIKEVRALNKQRLIDEEGVSEQTAEKLTTEQKEERRLDARIKKLTADLKSGNFLEEKKEPTAPQLSRKTILQKDKVIQLEDRIRIERAKDAYAKRSKLLKAYDKVMEVLGIRRIVQTAVDISIPFRQGATLIGPRRITTWAKSFGKMLNGVFSPTKFSRMMYEIRHSKDYHDMTKDGIVFNEMDAADPAKHNEEFQKSFIYKIPVVREPLLASNRAADAFLNTARYELYMKFKDRLESQGITRQSDPEAYKRAANWTMNMTGRGKMHKIFENKEMQSVLGHTWYGARLMASRFNLLNPLTYFDPRIPREVKIEAMKDLASFVSTTLAIGYALSQSGAKVSTDPDASDFLQVRYGDKVYDISGGLANYVRTYLRIINAAKSKITDTKHQSNKKIDNASNSLVRFFRNKLAPNTAYLADAFWGKPGGKPFDPYEPLKIYPMYADDAIKAAKEDGSVSLLTVLLPNLVGIGYGNYGTKGTIDKDIDTLLERNMRSDEMNKELIKNYTKKEDGEPITDKQFEDFSNKRDEEVKKGITELFNKGADVINDQDEVVHLPYNKMTQEQVVRETTNIKVAATRKIKEEMFGKEEKSEDRKQAEKELRELKKEDKEE